MVEMPKTPFPSAAEPPTDPWLLERLLSGDEAAQVEEPQLHALMAALRAPATPRELSGEPAALAVFAAAQTRPGSDTGRSAVARLLPRLVASKVGAAAVVVAVGLGGSAAAAYTGSLPAPVQDIAHRMVGAPTPDVVSSTGQEPAPADSNPEPAGAAPRISSATTAAASPGTGPDALGPAAFGLCAAYSRGGLATTSTAYASLLAAAGRADHITSFCATVQNPRNTPTTPSPTGSAATNGAGHSKPSTHPTGKPATHPTGKPSTKPKDTSSQSANGKPPKASGTGRP